MADVLLRKSEECDPDSFVLWDSVWQPSDGLADWAMAGADETFNRGGLSAKAALATAVTIALFSDKRIDETHPLWYLADGDPRGYWGDAIDVRDDLGETELGSHLWLLERAPLTLPGGQSVGKWAEQFAIEALEPLRRQGAIVRIEVEATVSELHNRLELLVRLYGRNGDAEFDRKFDLIWKQISR